MRRTRSALVGALVELVLEKRYRSITVQNLLDRADVGRSTFYSHYRGKDDLLLRSFEGMLDVLDAHVADEPGSPRLAPVRELFHHVGMVRDFHRGLARAQKIDLLFNAGTVRLATTIAARIARRRPDLDADGPELAALARAASGSLFALLRWWLDQRDPPSPEAMDELYHSLLLVGVAKNPAAGASVAPV